jgi:hypothetical protein
MHRTLSGVQFAHIAGVNPTTIVGLERRHKTNTRARIEKLAKAVHISPEQLLISWPHGMKLVEDYGVGKFHTLLWPPKEWHEVIVGLSSTIISCHEIRR